MKVSLTFLLLAEPANLQQASSQSKYCSLDVHPSRTWKVSGKGLLKRQFSESITRRTYLYTPVPNLLQQTVAEVFAVSPCYIVDVVSANVDLATRLALERKTRVSTGQSLSYR